MAGRFDEQLSRWKDVFSRLNLDDRRSRLILISISTLVIVVATVLALPSSQENKSVDNKSGVSIASAQKAAEEFAKGGLPLAGAGKRSSGTTSVGGTTPGGEIASAPPELPPITDTTVKVGITYTEDPGGANAAAGFGGIGQVDQRRGWEALVKQINADPPFGRKIAPVWFSKKESEIIAQGAEQIEQEACTYFTKDNPVFLVWDGSLVGGSTEVFNACATKHRIPEIGGGGGLSSTDTYEKYPYMVEPASVALDRMAGFLVDRFYDLEFFSQFKDQEPGYTPVKPVDNKPIIGLLRYDLPSYNAGAKRLKERLAAHGLALCDGCDLKVSYHSSDPRFQLDDATEINAHIQTLKAKNVTHLMMLGSTAGCRIALFFTDGAEKQNYRPRLGLNPLDCADTIQSLNSSSNPQWRQSVLVTWNPRQWGTETEGYKKCKKTFEDAGETFGGSDAADNKGAQIALYCNTAWYFASTLEATGRDLNVDTWMNGVNTGPPVESASTYLMKTTAERHDGTGAIRAGKWFDNCTCWKPTTGVIPV